jgi:hypothetical protein
MAKGRKGVTAATRDRLAFLPSTNGLIPLFYFAAWTMIRVAVLL